MSLFSGGENVRVERRRVQGLSDPELVLAMRGGDDYAWSEFYARCHPVLVRAAVAVRYDRSFDLPCVDELLSRIALHLASPDAPVPSRLAPYLLSAAARCRREHARNLLRLHRRHASAVHESLALELPGGEEVVGSVYSQYSRELSTGLAVDEIELPSAAPRRVDAMVSGPVLQTLIERLAA